MLLSCKSPPVTVVLGIRPSSTRNLGFPCCNSFVLFLSNIHLCCFPSVCSLHQHSFLSPGESANGSISQARPDRCPFPGGEARGGGGGGVAGGPRGLGRNLPLGRKAPISGAGRWGTRAKVSALLPSPRLGLRILPPMCWARTALGLGAQPWGPPHFKPSASTPAGSQADPGREISLALLNSTRRNVFA